jgi:hypothetical protein
MVYVPVVMALLLLFTVPLIVRTWLLTAEEVRESVVPVSVPVTGIFSGSAGVLDVAALKGKHVVSLVTCNTPVTVLLLFCR